MTVQLLAQNILTDAHFLSAGSQASGFWGQPAPAAANTGAFRLLSQGDAADFTYTGTTTDDGNEGKTTLIDTNLYHVFGAKYFMGGTVTVAGETRTISDHYASGLLVVSVAFTARVMAATAYTITVPFATRDFRIALFAGGDAGDAEFSWSHDGGTTYLNRDNPNQADWPAGSTVFNNVTANRCALCQAADGALLGFYNSAADTKVYVKRSVNAGLIWGDAILVSASNRVPRVALALKSGRIMVFMDKYVSYSDDHGLTWADEQAGDFPSTAGNIYDCIELTSGVLMAAYRNSSDHPAVTLSPDGGFSWTGETEVATGGGSSCTVCLVRAGNGNVICAYSELVSSYYRIRCKISENNGYTWGSYIGVYFPSSVHVYSPRILKDIDGTIFLACYNNTAAKIAYLTSLDHGATWSAVADLYTAGSPNYPALALVDGHRILCGFTAGSNFAFCHRGFWDNGGSSGQAAIEAMPQKLICGAELVWHGSGGVTADAWDFQREYDFGMENMIADSPSKSWRTAADGADYAVVIDLGANARFYADGVAFFGCNVRQVTFQMNATDSWGSPSVDKDVDFTLATGTVDDVDGNAIQDTSLLANYADHELKGLYLRMTNGTDSGATWKILDNVSSWILLDTTAATNVADTNAFAIFGTKAAGTFTAGLYRYCRILIENQQTAENYYQIGYAALGRMTSLDRGIASGFGRTRQANVEMLRTPAGGMIPIRGADPKNVFELTFPNTDLGRRQLVSILDAQQGQNMVLVPDSGDLLDVHLVKAVSDARQTHVFLDGYNVVLTLEEVL